MRPLEGVRNPSNALSIVLLPAPFGPRRPTRPRPNAAVTLLSATLSARNANCLERDNGFRTQTFRCLYGFRSAAARSPDAGARTARISME
mgnify:CR=1 FL=1